MAAFKQSISKPASRDASKPKKKHVSDLSESSSSFSDYQCDKKSNKFHSITHISSIKPAKNITPDLPRDKESFNKRKNLNEVRKAPSSIEDRNNNPKDANAMYYFGQNRRKTDLTKNRLEIFLKEDLKNTIISLKNSIEIARTGENTTLKQKWREAQEKSLERAGKIINQSNKLKPSYPELSQLMDENNERSKPKINNFIADDSKPASLLRKKPNNSFVSSGSASFNNNSNQNNQNQTNNNNQKLLAEKLKKEILAINEPDANTSSYILAAHNRKPIENRSFMTTNPANVKSKKETVKEKRSVSMRRTLNSLLETLSSEDEEEKKGHLQRKSLNPGIGELPVHKNERKDIEKIYKEYKSRKI